MPNFEKFMQACEKISQNEEEFLNFKRNPDYFEILEHIDNNVGSYIYKQLLFKDNDLVSKENLINFCSKDIIGNPVYLLNIEEIKVSPTTLRYIKVLSDIRKYFSLNEKNIIEIGAGYGGQAKILIDYYKTAKYDCVDLPQTHDLIKKYLNDYDINLYQQKTIPDKTWELCISNYAFSECPIEVQEDYFNKIILNSKFGYFTMNHISSLFGVNSYSKEQFLEKLASNNFKYTIKEEDPKTAKDNYIILYEKI